MQGHDARTPHGQHKGLSVAGQKLEKDPVCGMTVPADAPLRTTHDGRTYVFCSESCLARFQKEPERYLPKVEDQEGAAATPRLGGGASQAVALPDASARSAPTQWTCPMHPQIVRDKPGTCPICGMALEPRAIAAEEGVNPELVDMRRRP